MASHPRAYCVDYKMIDTKEIELAVKDLVKTKVELLVAEFDIKSLIANTVDAVIAEKVNSSITTHVATIVKKGQLERDLADRFNNEIQAIISSEIKNRTANAVAKVDIATEVGKHIDWYLDDKIKSAALPHGLIHHQAINWDGFTLSANALTEGTIKNFTSAGIQDVAENTELTVADHVVIIENTLIVRNAEVKENFAVGDMVVDNITVNNQMMLNENINKQFVSLIKDTFYKESSQHHVDVLQNPILANGEIILNENSLGPSIITSNLRKLGRLTELNVAGIAQFNDTLLVTSSGKVGINTSEPDGALTIWDDDSDFTVRRLKKKNMYIGTMGDATLSIGVNGDAKLTLLKDGTVSFNILELGGLKLSVSNRVPQGIGNPGEIVIMSNAQDEEPWAYRCIGGDRWKAIK